MNRLRILIPAILLVAAMVGSSQPADAKSKTLVATIHGRGSAVMDGPVLFGGTTYSIDARLFSDGLAEGFFDCVDVAGSTFPGDVFGPIKHWKKNVDGTITLSGTLQLLGGGPATYAYTLTIQKFGGPGTGHWTLSVPIFAAQGFGEPICTETLTSGRLVLRQKDWQD
ncbi:MAG: hypothetical protein M3T56_20065 [Chloroflexota bacterium]|nr:hypothetical protein [Chloroflexota bacterium]